jgi:hypothetical protein
MTGVFARTGTGGEAHLSVGTNSIGLVELVVLGAGKAAVLLLTPEDSSRLALQLRLASRAAAAPLEPGDDS